MIPGANILASALSIVARQNFQYHAFRSRTPNDIGQDVTEYAPPFTLTGSVQPVPRSLYEAYGLDFQRNYINIYVSRSITDVERDVSGDKVVFGGKTYECISKTPWAAIDGWDAVMAVQVTC